VKSPRIVLNSFMANTRENLIEMNKKAVLSPNIGKHGKRKTTIEKEKRRAIFDEIVSEEFKDLIKVAKAEYKIDQFMGKTPDVIGATDDLKDFLMKLNGILKNDKD